MSSQFAAVDLSNYATAAAMSAIGASIPLAASSTPPAIAVSGNVGTQTNSYALANHTHATSVQRKIITTSVSGGVATATWTFTTPYAAKPAVNCTPEANSSGQPYIAEILSWTLVSTQYTAVTIRVSQTQTLAINLAGVTAGLNLSPTTAAPAGVTLHCLAGIPTQ